MDYALAQKLADGLLDAWHYGDAEDRSQVLSFVFWTKVSDRFPLIVEALLEANEPIAKYACGIAHSLIFNGYDLGPEIEQALDAFGSRFPESKQLSSDARQLLQEQHEDS